MSLTSKIRELLRENNPDLLENIETFTKMEIDPKLKVINPEAYNSQIDRLAIIQSDNHIELEDFLTENIEELTQETLKTLTEGQPYVHNGYGTMSAFTCYTTNSAGSHSITT